MIRTIVGRVVLAMLAVTFLAPQVARAATPPATLNSNYETATGRRVSQDGGWSIPLPTDPSKSLWLFGDTVQYDANGNPWPAAFPFWPGTFAAIGSSTPGEVPADLSYVPKPGTGPMTIPNNNGPTQFLPNPANFTGPNGQPCMYSATWGLGADAGPAGPLTIANGDTPVQVEDASKLLFFSYIQVCVIQSATGNWEGLDLIAKRFGVSVYDPTTNAFIADKILFAADAPTARLPWQHQLFHPKFVDGYMYLYAYNCDNLFKPFAACMQGRAGVARVPIASILDSSAYEYKIADGWSTDYNQATDVLGNTGLGTLAIDVADFTAHGKGYLMMEQTTYGGHYKLWQSATPDGPWTKVRDGVFPCSTGAGGGCYHLWGHSELSPSDKLMYSYYDIKNTDITLLLLDDIPTLP